MASFSREDTYYNLPPGRFVSGDEYLLSECPECGKKNHFYYNVELNRGKCHSCQTTVGSLWKLKKLCDNFEDVAYEKPYSDKSSPLFNIQRLSLPCAWDVPDCRKVLLGRRASEADVRRVGIQWLQEMGYMVFLAEPISPDYPPGVWYRALQGWPSKWIPREGTETAKYGLGMKYIPESRKHILLVEGLYDILAPGLLGYAVTMFGTNLSDYWVRYIRLKKWKVSFWLDPDEAGYKATAKMTKKLQDGGVEVGRDFVGEGFARDKEPGDLDRWDSRIVKLKQYFDTEEEIDRLWLAT